MSSQAMFIEAVRDSEAANIVEAWSQAYNQGKTEYQLCKYDNDEIIESSFEITERNDLSMLLWHGSQEEVVLSVVGMVVEANLPPIGKDARFTRQPHKAHEVVQTVSITALPGGAYEQAVSALQRIYRFMGRRYRVGQLSGCPALTCGFLDVIKASKRYLTLSKDKSWPEAPIKPSIDPIGVLQRLVMQGEYRYTADNVVEYFECSSKNYELEQPSYIDPSLIRPGQIVEMSMTFRGLKRGDRRIFLVGLDSITLLDRVGVAILNRLGLNGDAERKRICNQESDEDEVQVSMPLKRGGKSLIPPSKRMRNMSYVNNGVTALSIRKGPN